MRRFALLVAALVASACGTVPMISEEAAPFVAADLRQANENWFLALAAENAGLLEPLLGEDVTIHFPDGTAATKASLLDDIRSGRLKFDAITGEQSRTRLQERTAVITGTAMMQSQREGQPSTSRVRYTAVYGWTGTRWRMLAWQGTPAGS